MHSKLNILVVDDQPSNLLALEAVLTGLDENLVFANSGDAALKQLLSSEFAVVLLDIWMPGMDGFEVARFIRSRPRSATTPIIFLTAAEDAAFPIEEAYALGAVDYLTKPFIPIVLRTKVAFFVDLHRKNAELAAVAQRRHAAALDAKDERIRLILDNVKDYAFVGTNHLGEVTEWEGGAHAITGWSKDDAIGQQESRIAALNDVDAEHAAANAAPAATADRMAYRRWHLRKDGRRFFAEGVIVSLMDADGGVQGHANIFRDATLAQQISADLQASQERFARLLESSADGIVGIAADSCCTFVNSAGAAMLAYLPQELLGAPILDIMHHGLLTGSAHVVSESKIANAARTGESIRVDDDLFWRKDGIAVPVAYSVAPMIIAGVNTGAVITFTDVTARKRAEEELRRLAGDLAIADQRKTEFLATLGHELRNPLAPIRTSLKVLSLASDNQATIHRVRTIMERQVNHMVNLVDDLLDIARISSGNIELKKERVELRSIIATALEISLPVIEANAHAKTLHVPDEPLVLDVDPTRIAQVLSNILNNAAKYTPNGGHINVTVERDGDEVVIAIADTGLGIPSEALPTVFEMFAQVDRNMERASGGLGIGLSLVRRLVTLHGGTVTAKSDGPGKGSVFTVRLPLLAPHASVDAAPAGDKVSTEANSTQFLRIVVVDADRDAAYAFTALLEMVGHATQVAATRLEAIQTCHHFRPHLMFVDIGLPDQAGYDFAQAVRKIPDCLSIVLIALSDSASSTDRKRAIDAGFDEYLSKPVAFAEVDRLLARLAGADGPGSARLLPLPIS